MSLFVTIYAGTERSKNKYSVDDSFRFSWERVPDGFKLHYNTLCLTISFFPFSDFETNIETKWGYQLLDKYAGRPDIAIDKCTIRLWCSSTLILHVYNYRVHCRRQIIIIFTISEFRPRHT